jgi:putative hemolysin
MLASMPVPRPTIKGLGPFTWLRAAALAGCLLLAACSGPSFSVPVDNVVIGASNSAGMICYVKGGASSPVRFASASYRATGTYQDDNLVDETAVIRIYGRTEAPSQPCVGFKQGTDRLLSDPIDLPENTPVSVEVGTGDYGAELAAIIHSNDYWLGAKVSDNFTLVGDAKIRLEDGRISVAIW